MVSLFAIFVVVLLIGNWEHKKIEEFKRGTLKSDYVKLVIDWDPLNQAPSISAGPSDGGSCTSTPSNVGDTITFSATGTDPDGDDYYLLVCQTNSVSTSSEAAPSCASSQDLCISDLASSTEGSTCSTTSASYLSTATWDSDLISVWYAYICDYGTDQRCSSVSQGTGDTGYPININRPPIDFVDYHQSGPVNPGVDIFLGIDNFTGDDDYDVSDLFFCKTSGATGNGCSGEEYCSVEDIGIYSACDASTTIPSEGVQDCYMYVFDEHGLGSSNNASSCAFIINNVAPVLSSISLNSGASIDMSTGGEGLSGNKDIIASATVTDNNGCADIASVVSHTYTTDIGPTGCDSSGENDANDCYWNTSCSVSSACSSGISYDYECTINFKYHADPTDASTPKVSNGWETKIIASDGDLSDNGTSTAIELISYLSLDVSSAIEYGSLGIDEMGDSDNLTTTTDVKATGNCGLDVELSGTNMTGSGTIVVGQQKYATSGVAYSSAIALTSSAEEFELNVEKPTTTSASPLEKIYWGLQIPGSTSAGSYSGTNTFTAKKAETEDW